MSHAHSFSVDTSCECGLMLSEYTRSLAKSNAELVAALSAILKDLQAKIDDDDNPIGRCVSGEYWNRACALLAKLEAKP